MKNENKKKLNSEFSSLHGSKEACSDNLEHYRNIASQYAEIENAIAILSDLNTNRSYMYFGKFAKELNIEHSDTSSQIDSIWEDQILILLHPDDLKKKFLHELRFFHHFTKLPKKIRFDHYLISKIRMQNHFRNYIPVVHRMFYIADTNNNTLRFALCLYNPMVIDFSGKCYIVNSKNGQKVDLDSNSDTNILTKREKEILNLIDKGMMSKSISESLCISINTVNRHRQEILKKLQVKNSIEACRIAKDLHLM
jgi:DNA-binding CsgD family transcriptional regulator